MVSLAPPMLPTPLLNKPKPSRKHSRDSDSSPDSTAPPVKTKRVRFAELANTNSLPTPEHESAPNSPRSANAVKPRRALSTPDANSTVVASSLFKKFVETAIDERAAGKPAHYEDLRRKFQADPAEENPDRPIPSSTELQMTLAALSNVVSRLNQGCAKLVEDVISTTWVGRDDGFVGVYVRFLGNLVSAHANYMGVVTEMLVRNFLYLPGSVGRIPGYPEVEQSTMYDRVHYALQFILELVPTAAGNTLFDVLVKHFPYRDDSKNETIAYMSNLLRVIEYAPSLRQKLLNVIVDRVIKVDIAIQVELQSLPDDAANKLEESMTTQEVEDSDEDEEDAESDSDSDEEESDEEEEEESDDEDEDDDGLPTPDPSDNELDPDTAKKTQSLHASLSKLDAMLSLLFAHYAPLLSPPCPSTSTFTHLHTLFHSTILPTHRSRYTQFLIFWAAQKTRAFSDAFCVSLLEKAMDNTRPARTRCSAAAYIASFIARAKSIPATDIRTVVSILCRWLAEFVELRESECDGPDPRKWPVFYAVAQAVMYIFCFRHQELDDTLDTPELADPTSDSSFIEEDPTPKIRWGSNHLPVLNKVIHSKFNPLKCCDQTVVLAFARIAEKTEFLYCWSVVEENRRRGKVRERLEGYFPFDPVALRRTGGWVGGCYLEWRGGDESDDEEEDEDEGETSDEEEVEDASSDEEGSEEESDEE